MRAATRRRWGRPERVTAGLALVAAATTAAVAVGELGRVWHRGSAPLPGEADDLLQAAEEAVVETVEVAVQGYQDVSTRENALFNMLASFVTSFVLARGIAFLLRRRRTVGPFRVLRVGHRHVHHFIPGIVLAFGSGAIAILTRDESLEPRLALAFGSGLGLTLDESALLLELDDVYWSREGLLSVQISSAAIALMGAVVLGLRFLRRGEELVLERGEPPAPATPPAPASA